MRLKSNVNGTVACESPWQCHFCHFVRLYYECLYSYTVPVTVSVLTPGFTMRAPVVVSRV